MPQRIRRQACLTRNAGWGQPGASDPVLNFHNQLCGFAHGLNLSRAPVRGNKKVHKNVRFAIALASECDMVCLVNKPRAEQP
jgi:hypothetical protein